IVSYQTSENGYTLTMSDGSSIQLSNGKNGSNGSNGTNGTNGKDGTNGTNGINAPVMGTKLDTDGIYYWTLAGEFLVQNGQKIPITGNDGQDGTNGADGTDGTDGSDGSNGSNGSDAISPQVKVDAT